MAKIRNTLLGNFWRIWTQPFFHVFKIFHAYHIRAALKARRPWRGGTEISKAKVKQNASSRKKSPIVDVIVILNFVIYGYS